MDAQVISIDSKRKKKPVNHGPEFYCLRCDKADFKLYESGIVCCFHCGSVMRNLLVQSCPEAS